MEDPDRQDDDQNGKKPRFRSVLLAMNGKFVFRLGLVALFLVAFLGALTQLLAGRRPVLLGGAV